MGKESKGFIKIDRNMFDHWIFQDAERFRAFVDLIQLARWKDEKLLIGNDIVIVPRGSYYTSELKLADRWSWGRDKTRSFLSLLEKEKMITKNGTTKGTMITVTSYRDYQDITPTNPTTKTIGNTKVKGSDTPTVNTPNQHQTNIKTTTNPITNQHQTNIKPDTKEEVKEVKEIKEIKERKEGEEGEEGVEIGPVLPSLSTPTDTHKLFLDRFGEVAYKTWLINKEIVEDDTTVKIFVESDFYKNALEKYISSLEILINKKIDVEVIKNE